MYFARRFAMRAFSLSNCSSSLISVSSWDLFSLSWASARALFALRNALRIRQHSLSSGWTTIAAKGIDKTTVPMKPVKPTGSIQAQSRKMESMNATNIKICASTSSFGYIEVKHFGYYVDMGF